MLRFTGCSVHDHKLTIGGPITIDPDATIKRLSVMVSQRGVMVEGEGTVEVDQWSAVIDAPGILSGQPAYAVGVAVLTVAAVPPAPIGVQHFTWCMQVPVTEGLL